jgi:hypothetical protein
VVANDIEPAGINQGFAQPGLVEETGGRVMAYDFKRAVDLIWRDASHYYLISYQPPVGKKRDLHSIAVKVRRRGAQVRTRASRQLRSVKSSGRPRLNRRLSWLKSTQRVCWHDANSKSE